MKLKVLLFVFILLLAPATLLCRINGSWRQVFPEENGEIPGPRYGHYMCHIGEQQVLMIGGAGGGNPNYYGETWLYNYKANTGTKVPCDSMPDVYSWASEPGNYLHQISKTRAIASCFNTPGIFDLDSMEGYKMPHEGGRYSSVYIKENVMFVYSARRGFEEQYPYNIIYAGMSSLCTMHPEEPFDSPNFLTSELVNNEGETKQGPVVNDNGSYAQQLCFTLNNDSQSVIFIPEPTIGDDPKPKFMGAERNIGNWMSLEQSQDTLPIAGDVAFASLTNNITLIYTANIVRYNDSSRLNDTTTYLVEYVPENKHINVHHMKLFPNPGDIRGDHRIAQIDDGIIMLFGGERYDKINGQHLSNQTGIFEIDKEDVVDNMGDSVKIYMLDDNLYMLADEIKNAVLYNILGQKVVAVSGDRLDINSLSLGVYFLQYTDGKGEKVAKIVKK